jgi:uncharacterized protein YbjT (DUF2867 family)
VNLISTLLKIIGYLILAAVVVLAGYVFLMSGIFHKPEGIFNPSATTTLQGDVLVVGGTSGTGLEIVKVLQERGVGVVSTVRSTSNTAALDELGVRQVVMDALEPETIRAAITPGRYAAVVSTLGTAARDLPKRQNSLTALVKGQTKMDPMLRPDFVGNRDIIDASRAAGVRRFILVTVIGTGDSADAVPLPARRGHNEVIPLKAQAEDYLRASGLDYTVVRPGGLGNRVYTGNARLTADPKAFSYMGRADLGRLVADALFDPETLNQTYTDYDPERLFLWNLFFD